MSTPRVVTSSFSVPCWGRARAADPATRPSAAATRGACRRRARQPRGLPAGARGPGTRWRAPTARGAARPGSRGERGGRARARPGPGTGSPPRSITRPFPPTFLPSGAGASSSAPTADRTAARWRSASSVRPSPRANLMLSAAVARSRSGPARTGSCGPAAQEGEHLRARHLLHGRAQPPLEVALGDGGELDVERPVARRARDGRRRPGVEGPERFLVGRDGGHGRPPRRPGRFRRLPEPEAEGRASEEHGDGEADPEGPADVHPHRSPDVRELLRVLVLGQEARRP